MESFLWIGITFATFSFLGIIPVANDVLKMIERCSDISSVSSLGILVGMLFGPADFLGVKYEIISIISSFVQSQMKNESWIGGGKYSKNLLYESGTSDSTSAATEQKKLLKVYAIVCGSVTVWSSRLVIYGISFVVFWKEIMDLIPFQVFSCY